VVVGAVACLAACSGKVEVASPALTGEAAKACRAFVAALPESVGDQKRRKVDGAFVAAYGDPAIVLRCGVPDPAGLTPVSPCVTVNGVDWFADENDDRLLATTIGRQPNIEMLVPAGQLPPDAEYVDVARAIKQTTKRLQPCL
jgi:hypothetical protein